MDRDSFIRTLEGCIVSATGRKYPHIDWTKMTDRGLIECAELVRDLLEKRMQVLGEALSVPAPQDGKIH